MMETLEMLTAAREVVCSLSCPSAWTTGQRPPHSPLCQQFTAYVAAFTPAEPPQQDEPLMERLQQEKERPMKSGWQEKHRWPPFTHGRVVCACGHVVAQCRCPQGCEVVGTVDTCEKCMGERRTLPVVPTAVEAKTDTNLIQQSAPDEPQTPEPTCRFCNRPTTMSQLIQAGACSDCAGDELMPAAPVSSSARPDSQTVEPICVCQVDDGLVQEWVSKARAVAIGKGFNPLPRCCLDMGDGYVCALWKGHEGGCSGHREAAPRLSIEWPEVIDGYTRSEMHNAIMDGDTKIAFNVLGVVSHYYAPCSRQERIGSAPVPLSEALGSAGRSAAQENSSSSQEQADARPARTLKDYRPQHDEDCLINKCGFVWSDGKGCRVAPSDHDVYISHVLLPQPCSCGLDALLSGGHGQ